MITYRKYLVFLLLFTAQQFFSRPKIIRVNIDSTKVERVTESKKEQDVFKDPAFNFKEKEIKRGRNFIKDFWDWLFKGKKLEEPNAAEVPNHSGTKNAGDFWSADLVTRIVIIVSCTILFATLIYLFVSGKFKKLFAPKPKESSFDFNEITENIRDIDIDQLVTQAIHAGNFRLATRWSYLKILKKLTLSNKIVWEPYKTNLDYYYELSSSEYLNEFKSVSKVYDYVWYGELRVTEAQYLDYLPAFTQLEKSIDA